MARTAPAASWRRDRGRELRRHRQSRTGQRQPDARTPGGKLRSPAPPARRRSRRPTLLIVLGLLAAAVFVIATLPAGVVVSRLQRYGSASYPVGGTVWSGQPQCLAARCKYLG